LNPPIVSIVGRSGSGKTTLVSRLVPELKDKGYRVCTIKHNSQGFEIDHPGKDTWKHREAGADVVMISSASRLAIMETVKEEVPLDSLVEKAGGVDLVITEGYKRENKPKIEVVRGGYPLLSRENEENVLAYAGEVEGMVSPKVPCFNWDQVPELSELIEKKMIGGV